MSKRKDRTDKRGFSRIWDKNIFVFGFSLIIAVILWSGVSMFQTTEIDQQFKDIKINIDASALEGTDLKLFSATDLTVDVTVRGKSYLLKDSAFAGNITATVSLDSVESPGSYPLPVKVTVSNANVELVEQSKDVVTLYFDRLVMKDYPVEVRVLELADYKIDGSKYVRGEPIPNTDTVTVEGPSNELGRLDKVVATVALNEELTQTVENIKADLSFEWIYQASEAENLKYADGTEVLVTIPVSYISEYSLKPKFVNVPETFDEADIPFTVSPETVKITDVEVDTSAGIEGGVIEVGPIDFNALFSSEGRGLKKTFESKPVIDGLTFDNGITEFTVTADLSTYDVLWVEVKVVDDNLPEGYTLQSKTVRSVQIVCPEEFINSEAQINRIRENAYARVRLSGYEFQQGMNENVPVDIYVDGDFSYWIRNAQSYRVAVNVQ